LELHILRGKQWRINTHGGDIILYVYMYIYIYTHTYIYVHMIKGP
jgi:hypothetical protein